MEEVQVPGSLKKKKKHRRGKSTNLETQGELVGSTEQLITEENPRLLRARQQTKARFESFLQDAVPDDSVQEVKKKKKKKRTPTADAVLDQLRAGSPIAKTPTKAEENVLEANLFRGDDSVVYEKENKQSYKELMEETSHPIKTTEEDTRGTTPKKSKHRKTKSTPGEMVILEDQQKRRRRKQPKTPENSVDDVIDGGQENLGYDEEPKHEPQTEITEKEKVTTKKRRGDRARRRLEASGEGHELKKRNDDGYILSVTVHRSDRLRPDLYISHPLVRVHVMDINTENYVKKSSRSRNVTSYYEGESANPVDYIMPVMTQPFDFKKNKSLTPAWEEVLIFNDIFSYFLSRVEGDPNVIILFELVDFLSVAATSKRKDAESNKGWYQIAWGFLKIVGGNGSLNTDKKVRLQLFYPPKLRTRSSPVPEVFQWWKLNRRRIPYPSTLYVTLKGVLPPKDITSGLRSMFAIQQEKGRVTFEELTTDAERRAHGMRDSKAGDGPTNWTRLPGQVNRIPNKQSLSLASGKRGCFVIKFSHNGRYLACGCADTNNFPVIVYEIPSGHVASQFPGHFSIIYDLCWSPDDSDLISASSDGTVRAWDCKTMMTSVIKTYPHPCFVYSAQYHPSCPHLVVTGGYDFLIRVWSKMSDTLNGQLLREIDGHLGFVNSISFDEEGNRMFSADSTGVILMWHTMVDPKMKSSTKKSKRATGGNVYDWMVFKKIEENEIKGHVINSVLLHPNGWKLLVHTRNSAIYMLDLRSYTIMKRYLGASNFKEHLHSTISACGTFVISGSEDGLAYVWNTETGDLVSMYTKLGYLNGVSDVHFHPKDHMVAFCSFGDCYPTLVYYYDAKFAREEAKKLLISPTTPLKATVPESPIATPETPEKNMTVAAAAHNVLRMKKVKDRLDSVLATPATPRPLDTAILRTPDVDQSLYQTPMSGTNGSMYYTPSTPGHLPGSPMFRDSTMKSFGQGIVGNVSLSTWGSDFSPTMFDRGNTYSPIAGQRTVSPHAKQYLGASGHLRSFQLHNLQFPPAPDSRPKPQGYGQIFPGQKNPSLLMSVNAEDSPGPLRRSQLSATPPKPTFSFNAEANTQLNKVVAIYPYEANRADELTIRTGDVVTVLYQDSEHWWMGQLADGSQGYFPSNYVTEQEFEDDLRETNALDVTDGKTRRRKERTKMTAVVSKGDLKIISEDSCSEADTTLNQSSARRRRRHQQKAAEQETTLEGKKKSPQRSKR